MNSRVMMGSPITGVRGSLVTPPVRTVLEGLVQRLTLLGPGGNAAPSGLYLILSKPVEVDGQRFSKVFLAGAQDLQVGGKYVVSGDLSMVTKRDVTTTIHYAVLANAAKLEVEP